MSAFTNWNGPGDCCGGGIDAIPQINALNDLLAKYTAVELQIQSLKNDIIQHATQPTTVSSTGQPHSALQAAIVTLQNAINVIGSPGSYGTLGAYIAAVDDRVNGAQTTANTAATAAGNANAAASQALSQANSAMQSATTANTKIGTVKTGYLSIAAWLTAVETVVNEIKVTWNETTSEIVLLKNLRALDVLCQNIKMWWQIDFDDWKSSAAYKVASNTGTQPYIICELLELTNMDHSPMANTGYARKKPGRAYVRGVDTQAWSAIIDAVCASTSNDSQTTGALTVVATKTQSSPTASLGKMKFGVYKGTNSDGSKHIYLGVVHDPSIPISSPAMHFCGENVTTAPVAPAYGVETLAETAWIDGTGGTAFAEIHVEKIYSDNYFDARGNGVAVTDPNKTLTIGNDIHETIIISKYRPPVDDDEGTHQIAYLSDLHNSIVWQRAVTAYTPDLATLRNAKVWVTTDASGNPVVVRDGTVGASQVPGIYLTPHSATETGPVAGYIFQADDVALVKTSTLSDNTQRLADGKINVTIPVGSNITTTADKLIGFPDTSQIKVGYTTVVDNVGNYGKITAYTPGGSVTVQNINAASLPLYTKPMYVKFDGTAWTPDVNIDIPIADSNYVAALTYEWSGHHISVLHASDNYYTPSYILWTPHYQQSSASGSMNYIDVEEWSFIDITLAGVRDAAQQDIIDRAIIALAQEQPDWANYQPTRLTQIPGQGKSIQPDPSFIHNKPWAGLGVISGGGFNQPTYQGGWLVDGGEFTGMGGLVRNPAAAPPISPDDTYRNALIQVLHGKYEDMPEVKMLTDGSTIDQQNAIRANYAWQLRICTGSAVAANNGLYYSDGSQVYKLVGTAI